MIVICIYAHRLVAQLHDNTWFLGYGFSEYNIILGLTKLTFDDGILKIDTAKNVGFDFDHNNSAFSDDEGRFIAAFDGEEVMNKRYEFMENGRGMNVEIIKDYYYLSWGNISQGSVMLPWPEHPDSVLILYLSHLLFIKSNGDVDGASLGLNMAIINKRKNNGLGAVITRDVSIIEDTVSYGHLIPVKHANGRDWWVMVSRIKSNEFYTVLIDPRGPRVVERQAVNYSIINGVGQARFSQDGSKFIFHNGVDFSASGVSINFFDFDRCTGLLSNHQQYFMKGNFGGVSFSPNGRYAYQNVLDTAWRYDLQASDIWASRELIAVYDKFKGPFSTYFYLMQLAPDGKIYSSAPNGVNYLHVIHQPDEEDCQYHQHGIKLPKYTGFSVPNFPNYRLGPLDGSPCDTLGLNNDPRAWYRYGQDSLDALSVAFHDLSYHEPATWEWDFGDGSPLLRGVRHPEHQYPAAGKYEACLTVRNVHGSHTHCKTLYLGVSAQDNPVLQAQVVVSPNPFTDRLAVALSTPDLRRPVFRLFDVTGRVVRTERLEYGINEIETGDLAKGAYFWAVEAGGERVKGGKVMRL